MPATYEPIASTTVSAASEANFTSIAATWTDLVLTYNLTASAFAGVRLQFNGDTATNYSTTVLTGTGATALSARLSSQSNLALDRNGEPGPSSRAINVVSLMSYASSSVFKTLLSSASNADGGVDRVVGLWRSTSAITSIRVFLTTGTMTGDLALYGIKAA